jgi:PIN domain nuclease of toxin-antitoxin system
VKLLLDTHTLVWLIGNVSHIPKSTLAALREPRTELFVSSVSPFEISTKHRLGKFPEAAAFVLSYDQKMADLGASELPITARHGLVAGQLSWDHRDPFDRILAAQSILENLPLVTSDAVFASVVGVQTIWG